MAPEPHQLYCRWLDELWAGELGAAEELVADRFVGHWPDREVEGRDALVDLIAQTRAMFDSLSFELAVGPISEGDMVAARWTGVGRTDGAESRFFGNDLLRLEDGRFVEYWAVSSG